MIPRPQQNVEDTDLTLNRIELQYQISFRNANLCIRYSSYLPVSSRALIGEANPVAKEAWRNELEVP